MILSLELSKPTKSGNSYYYYSSNDMQAMDTGIKEQELGGRSNSEVRLRKGRDLRILFAGC